jgi:hypothetical protein
MLSSANCLVRVSRFPALVLFAVLAALPAAGQGPDTRHTLRFGVVQMAAAADCKRLFEELKEKL